LKNLPRSIRLCAFPDVSLHARLGIDVATSWDDATIDEEAVGTVCRSVIGIGESSRRSISLWAIYQWPAVLVPNARIWFRHLAGIDRYRSPGGKKGDSVTAYFVFTIGACLFGAALLAYDSYAERRERRAGKNGKR
jgi:hypothetical protein